MTRSFQALTASALRTSVLVHAAGGGGEDRLGAAVVELAVLVAARGGGRRGAGLDRRGLRGRAVDRAVAAVEVAGVLVAGRRAVHLGGRLVELLRGGPLLRLGTRGGGVMGLGRLELPGPARAGPSRLGVEGVLRGAVGLAVRVREGGLFAALIGHRVTAEFQFCKAGSRSNISTDMPVSFRLGVVERLRSSGGSCLNCS